jgi:oxazoline/thiazoline synthase
MLIKPRFKHHFRTEIMKPDVVYLLSEKGHSILISELYVHLAPFLNGCYTVSEITVGLQSKVSINEVHSALLRLENQGYITESENGLTTHEAAFWDLQNIDCKNALDKLSNTVVAVQAFGLVNETSFIEALESLKISIGNQEDFTVVLTDDYLQIGLDSFNRHAESTKKPWLLVKPIGSVVWIGPLFIPGETGCWECLAQRLRENQQVQTSIGKQKGNTTALPISFGTLPTTLQMSVNWAATETAKCLVTGKEQQLSNKLITFNTITLSMEEHILVKRPQCAVCGCISTQQQKQPIILQNRRKKSVDAGDDRRFSAEDTFRRYQHHISPITGIVNSLSKIECNCSLIHVHTAGYQFGEKLDSLNSLRQGLKNRSAGKGKTDIQSKVSALCEAVERYSGLFTKNTHVVKKTFFQIEAKAIHPNCLTGYSTKQYQERKTWNLQHGDYAWIAEPFNEDREIDWTPVWSLTNKAFKYLPTAFCYYGYVLDKEHQFCRADSNGNASGSSLEEAIIQGFMEVVERDCVAMWWYNRLKRPSVDLHSFSDPYLEALIDFFQEQNCEFWVLDITNDLNIPSFAAVAHHIDKHTEKIMLGFGAHFDPKIGIIRAVTELNQMFAINLQQGEQQKYTDPDEEYWMKNATIKNQPYLTPSEKTPKITHSDYHKYLSEDLKEDVIKCVEIAASNGMEVLVLDQTRPDIQINVVKVIVPGLCHFWPRFAPKRLYDVPVKMGWLSTPLKEKELNPIPVFI